MDLLRKIPTTDGQGQGDECHGGRKPIRTGRQEHPPETAQRYTHEQRIAPIDCPRAIPARNLVMRAMRIMYDSLSVFPAGGVL
jgi:hypothetical protein